MLHFRTTCLSKGQAGGRPWKAHDSATLDGHCGSLTWLRWRWPRVWPQRRPHHWRLWALLVRDVRDVLDVLGEAGHCRGCARHRGRQWLWSLLLLLLLLSDRRAWTERSRLVVGCLLGRLAVLANAYKWSLSLLWRQPVMAGLHEWPLGLLGWLAIVALLYKWSLLLLLLPESRWDIWARYWLLDGSRQDATCCQYQGQHEGRHLTREWLHCLLFERIKRLSWARLG